MKIRLSAIFAIIIFYQLISFNSVSAVDTNIKKIKELNFVFLHGAGGNSCSMQPLADKIIERIEPYITQYEQVNPEIQIKLNMLVRCYPNDVDIDTWAHNVAESITKYYQNKQNLIFIGHSMGGKVALYTVAQNINNLRFRSRMVATINSPIRALGNYSSTGPHTILDYCRARWPSSGRGICQSITNYDSEPDGIMVGKYAHWLAFISGENTPSSNQFNTAGIDPLPRYPDDGLIPISAQYSEGADILYYGQRGHASFETEEQTTTYIAEQIIKYIFNKPVLCSFIGEEGIITHKATSLFGSNKWHDIAGDRLAKRGSAWHYNHSYSWQEYEDIVGGLPITGNEKSRYQLIKVRSSRFLTSIEEAHWNKEDDLEDVKIYIRNKAGPRQYIQIDWYIYQHNLLPYSLMRDRYEVEVAEGTASTKVSSCSWLTDNAQDMRLTIESEANRTSRDISIKWKTFYNKSISKNIIDLIPVY